MIINAFKFTTLLVINLIDGTHEGLNYVLSGTVPAGFSTLQLFHNGSSVGSPSAAPVGAFELTLPNTDLTEGVNTFFVLGVKTAGGSAVSNLFTRTVNIDDIDPTLNAGATLFCESQSVITVTWPSGSDLEAYGDSSRYAGV
jgi:hypothetical protein